MFLLQFEGEFQMSDQPVTLEQVEAQIAALEKSATELPGTLAQYGAESKEASVNLESEAVQLGIEAFLKQSGANQEQAIAILGRLGTGQRLKIIGTPDELASSPEFLDAIERV